MEKIIIPGWVKDNIRIHVIAGIEECAKRVNGKWYIKTSRCNMCGECCKRAPENWHLGRNEKGWCKYLKEYENDKYVCHIDRPLGCATGDYAEEPWCNIEWTEVK